MQAPHRWEPPKGTLGTLVDRAYDRARQLEPRIADLRAAAAKRPAPPPFAAALRREDVAIIAEVKRRSPSLGAINDALKAGDQAKAYVEGGAAALSILTEPEQFGGSITDLADVRAAVTAPLLRKDFIVDYTQIVEARAYGASAVLLIVRALDPIQLADLMEEASDSGLAALVEVHNESELERAIHHGATIIGVNNRDLETLAVDPTTSVRLIPKIPKAMIAVAESGVAQRPGVEQQAAAGADAVLCGSALSAAPDPAAAVRALVGVERQWRR